MTAEALLTNEIEAAPARTTQTAPALLARRREDREGYSSLFAPSRLRVFASSREHPSHGGWIKPPPA